MLYSFCTVLKAFSLYRLYLKQECVCFFEKGTHVSVHCRNNVWRCVFILTTEFNLSVREWVSVFNSCSTKKIPRWAFSSSASLASACTFHTLFGSREKQLAMFCKLAKLKMINPHTQTEKADEMSVIQQRLSIQCKECVFGNRLQTCWKEQMYIEAFFAYLF